MSDDSTYDHHGIFAGVVIWIIDVMAINMIHSIFLELGAELTAHSWLN